MVPELLDHASPLLAQHLTTGASTGYMVDQRGKWPLLVAEAASVSSFAIELSAIGEPELPGLVKYLRGNPALPFHFISLHAPSKKREADEQALVGMLARVAAKVDAIVVHPDTMLDVAVYGLLGRRLAVENMDTRKSTGHTADDLAAVFAVLPDAGLCLDLAHAKDVNATMAVAHELLDRFSGRLRHVHLSSLDADRHHVPLSAEDEILFAPVLERCRDVPWILEAPPRNS